jgi:hypothetical protein
MSDQGVSLKFERVQIQWSTAIHAANLPYNTYP